MEILIIRFTFKLANTPLFFFRGTQNNIFWKKFSSK